MCSITRRRVSGSRFPSRNAASVSSEGKPVCSICSTVLPQSDRRPGSVPESPVILVRGTHLFFSFTNQTQRHLVVSVQYQVVDLTAVEAGGLERSAEAEQQLVDPLVQLLHVQAQRPGDLRHLHPIAEAHP